MVSLLLVIVLAFLTRVRLELRQVSEQESHTLARANARLGLELAIAQLQKHAGPDQRVTGKSSILDPNIDTEFIENNGIGSYQGVQSPYWTGVWSPAPNTGVLPWQSGFDPHPLLGKSETNPKGTPAWLVSGNHGRTPGANDYRTPFVTYPVPELSSENRLRFVRLMGHPKNPNTPVTADLTLTDPKRIVGEIVEVPSSQTGPYTRFAFHVFDEGVKASLLPNTPEPLISGATLIARRSAIEKTTEFSSLSPAQKELFTRLVNRAQIPFTSHNVTNHLKLIHDFTPVSYSVQSDTANGGLKRDLSIAFDMPDNLFNQSPLFANSSLQRRDGSELRNGMGDASVNNEAHTWAPVNLSPMRIRSDAFGNNSLENAIWGPTWHVLRDYARLYLPATEHPRGYISINNGVPTYQARITGFGEANASRDQQFHQSRRMGDSVWNSNARPTNYFADSLTVGGGSFPYIYRPTRGAIMPILTKFVTRWAIQVDNQIQGDDPATRKRLRLIMQPAFTLWNPYNVAIEIPAIQFRYKPDSGAEIVVETELEPWIAGRFYRLKQEVQHNGNVYRYRPNFLASASEPGTAGDTEWESLGSSAARTVDGRVWGIGSMAVWKIIMGGENSYWTLVSSGTEVNRNTSNQIVLTQFTPIRFEPGEVKFFGPYDNQIIDGKDPAYTSQFLLREGSFAPHSGIAYDRIRTDPGNKYNLLTDTNGELILDATNHFRVTLGNFEMTGNSNPADRAVSVNGTQSIDDFYQMSANTWDRTVGNDGVELAGYIGENINNSMVGERVFHWKNHASHPSTRPFVQIQFMDSNFEVRFRYTHSNQWKGTPPPLNRRAMVFDPAPLNTVNFETLGQMEYYLKAEDDAESWPIQVFRQHNPRMISHFRSGNTHNGSYSVGYNDVHSHIQLLNDETNFAPNLSPIPQSNGKGYYGRSHGPSGEHYVMLFDIPRNPLLSLGQLQHAHVSPVGETAAYPIGNSDINPYIASSRERPLRMRNDYHSIRTRIGTEQGTSQGDFRNTIAVDHSWLLNQSLFDSFFFSSLKPWSDISSLDDWTIGIRRLMNSRILALPSASSVDFTDNRSYTQTATVLMAEGAFNINSTSVDAWKSILGSLSKSIMTYVDANSEQTTTPGGSPLPRSQRPLDLENQDWAGFRTLTDAELQSLAEEVVRQVKLRGPFLSLGDFVNRRLQNPGSDLGGRSVTETGLKGALQAAIDRSGINSNFDNIDTNRINDYRAIFANNFLDVEAFSGIDGGRQMMSMAAGHLSQADILQAIAPSITARSDTFLIRFYGDTRSQTPNSPIQAKAYGEAIVQRMPEYVDPSDEAAERIFRGDNGMSQDDLQRISPNPLQEGMHLSIDGPRYNGSPISNVRVESNLNPINTQFGRRFEIVAFRWLDEEDI